MRRLTNFAITVSLVTACGNKVDSLASILKSLKESSTIIKEDGDRFSVVCRDGTREQVTESDIATNNLCPFKMNPNDSELHVPGGDLSYELKADTKDYMINIGNEQWFEKSLVSFEITMQSINPPKIKIIDGNAKEWSYSGAGSIRFHRVISPIKIVATPSCYNHMKLDIKNISYHIANTKQLTIFDKNALDSGVLHTIGGTIPGVKIKFSAALRIFDNYEAHGACENINFVSGDKTFSLNQANKFSTLILNAPIKVITDPVCQSSRLATPENSQRDLELLLSGFEVLK